MCTLLWSRVILKSFPSPAATSLGVIFVDIHRAGCDDLVLRQLGTQSEPYSFTELWLGYCDYSFTSCCTPWHSVNWEQNAFILHVFIPVLIFFFKPGIWHCINGLEYWRIKEIITIKQGDTGTQLVLQYRLFSLFWIKIWGILIISIENLWLSLKCALLSLIL